MINKQLLVHAIANPRTTIGGLLLAALTIDWQHATLKQVAVAMLLAYLGAAMPDPKTTATEDKKSAASA